MLTLAQESPGLFDAPAPESITPADAMATGQAMPPDNVFEAINNIFFRPDALAHSQNLLENLNYMSIVWAVVFLAAGLVCLLHGFKFYKPVIIISALAIGWCAGYYLGSMEQVGQPYIAAACIAALLAVCCFPLMKYAVAVLGGLVGAFIGANLWTSVMVVGRSVSPDQVDNYWVGALVGLLVGGMLAFILFKLSIVLFTSVSGATITVLGALALLLQIGPWRESITDNLAGNALVIPMLVFVPAIIGLILQETASGTGKEGAAKTSVG